MYVKAYVYSSDIPIFQRNVQLGLHFSSGIFFLLISSSLLQGDFSTYSVTRANYLAFTFQQVCITAECTETA